MTTDDNSALLLSEQDGAVLKLILNRPDHDNCLSPDLVLALHRAIESAESNDAVHVVVIAATGPVFCGGQDRDESVTLDDPAQSRVACLASNDMMLDLAGSSKATIACVQGNVQGAGLELIAACDLAVAAGGAEFAASGVNFGLWDHSTQVALSRTLSRKHAMEFLLTGSQLGAADALRMGLINRVVEGALLQTTVEQLAASIAAKSRYAIGLGKYSYDHQAAMDPADAYEFITEQYYRDVQSEDAAEGMAALRERRRPRWKGR